MLVLDDANVERAAEGARKGSFSHGGQMCVGMERIYVHEDVYEPFTERFVALTKGMRLGAGFDYDYEMGSLLSQQQLETVSAHVADAVAKGATVLAGGRPRPDVGPFFYEPTVLADVTPEMTLYAEETFGPVVSLYRVRSDDEAVELANRSRYGLHFSVWTGDPSRGRARRAQARGRLGQRQRGIRRGLVVDRRADGRRQGLGRRPPPRRARHREVHRAADGRRAAGPADMGASRDRRRTVGDAPHGRPPHPAPPARRALRPRRPVATPAQPTAPRPPARPPRAPARPTALLAPAPTATSSARRRAT